MKYCEEYAALLEAFADGACTPEEEARVRAHLAECPGCQAWLDDILLMRGAFPDVEDTPVPEDFAQTVMAAIRAETPAAAAPRRPLLLWKKVLVPMAACLAVVVAVSQTSFWRAGSNAAPAADTAYQMESIEAASSAGQQADLRAVKEEMETTAKTADIPGEAGADEKPENTPQRNTTVFTTGETNADRASDSAPRQDAAVTAGGAEGDSAKDSSQEGTAVTTAGGAESSPGEDGFQADSAAGAAAQASTTMAENAPEPSPDEAWFARLSLTAEEAAGLTESWTELPSLPGGAAAGKSETRYALTREQFRQLLDRLEAPAPEYTDNQDGQLALVIVAAPASGGEALG